MKLSPSIEKKITADWRSLVPTMGVYKSRHLLRRAGPLLVGVCLERDSFGDKYKPCFHVHFLGKEFPVVSLTLCKQLAAPSGGPDYIELKLHDSKYEDAAMRLIEQSPLPILDSELSVRQIINAYEAHMRTAVGSRQAPKLAEDLVKLLISVGDNVAAEKAIHKVVDVVENETSFRAFGGRTEFEVQMFSLIDSPPDFDSIIELQVKALRVEALPYSDLAHSNLVS